MCIFSSNNSVDIGNIFLSVFKLIFSERVRYAVARPSVVCRLSVTVVHPTQPVAILGNISAPFGTLAIR